MQALKDLETISSFYLCLFPLPFLRRQCRHCRTYKKFLFSTYVFFLCLFLGCNAGIAGLRRNFLFILISFSFASFSGENAGIAGLRGNFFSSYLFFLCLFL